MRSPPIRQRPWGLTKKSAADRGLDHIPFVVSIAWPMTGKTIIATGAGVQTQPRRLQDQFTPTGSSPALVKKSECALRG